MDLWLSHSTLEVNYLMKWVSNNMIANKKILYGFTLLCLIVVHACVITPSYANGNVVSTKEANPFKQTMWYFTEMHLNQANPDDILFFGDSLVQGMNMEGLNFKAVNMGIGGYSIGEITNRMNAVKLIDYRGVIIEGGVNDILVNKSDHEIKSSYNEMFRTASASKMFYFAEMLPVDEGKWPGKNERIFLFNSYASKVCALFDNCKIIKTPDVMLKSESDSFYFNDGIHLKKPAYTAWTESINLNIKKKCEFISDKINMWDWVSSLLPCSNR